jgi:serine/threonine-protein kinase HipA
MAQRDALMPRYLEVWLHGQHLGWLCEAGRTTRFIATERYLANSERPTISLSMTVPGDDDTTRSILRNYFDPAIYQERGELPAFFAGLLPEGPLKKRLQATRHNPRDTDDFGVLAAAGEDLPGAVTVIPADLGKLTEAARAYGVTGGSDNLEISVPEAAAEGAASVSGIQDKLALSSALKGDKCHLPLKGTLSDLIAKLPLAGNDDMVMNEYTCMKLAALAGVNVARCRPAAMSNIEGHVDLVEALGANTRFLRVERFDRGPSNAVHMEDACQMLRQMPSQKYGTVDKYELLVSVLNRFSVRGIEDVRQFFIRQVVNTLLGNSDAHLKNTSVIYPNGIQPELSPAYDIVCVAVLPGFKGFGVNVAIDRLQRAETLQTYEAVANASGVSPKIVKTAVKQTVELAQETWRKALQGMETPQAVRDEILGRLDTLPLAKVA